jgi:PAS domain-containing protein
MLASERHIQDRLGVISQKLAAIERRASSPGESRGIQILLTDFRQLHGDLERAFRSLQEAAIRQAALQREVEISSRRAGLLLELSRMPYLLIEPGGIIVDANDAAARTLNLSRRFLQGKPFDVFLQGDREAFLLKLRQLREGSDAERWSVALRPRERSARPVTLVAAWETSDRIALIFTVDDREPGQETGVAVGEAASGAPFTNG